MKEMTKIKLTLWGFWICVVAIMAAEYTYLE